MFSIPIALMGFSQNCQLRLSGHVEDADTKDKLLSATVLIVELGKQIITDEKGDFIFDNLCAGKYTLQISHIDCQTLKQSINLDRNRHFDLFLPHAKNTLGEAVVIARTETTGAGFKKELAGRELQATRGLIISEALSKINGVTMLQTGSTISKPVIHGLHSSRILTIVNGVRQEGQQWGNEHAPEIDPFIADKLTVIKGVEELRYGSDAIGGVILVQPKPLQNRPGWQGEINTVYFTNNRQYVASGVFEQQLKSFPAFTYRLQGTYKRGANAATPGYRLNNTGSEEKNFSVTAGYTKEHFNTELFYSRFATKVGIFEGSHIGNLTDLQTAIDSDRPDPVFLGKDSYEIGRPSQDVTHQILKSRTQYTKNGHRFVLQLAGQFNQRKEYDIVRDSDKAQMNLSISTFTEDLSWEHPVQHNFSGVIGISAMQQDNAYAGRYFIPNYQSQTFGGYAIERWQKHKWEVQAGIRYDNKAIATNRLLQNGSSFDEYDFNFSTWAASANVGFKPGERWKLNATFSHSMRAPHVNELLGNGLHHGTATYEEGDLNLSAERALNVGATFAYHNHEHTISAEIHFYSNNIDDFIYRQPVPGEPVLTIAGAFPRIEYRQADAVLNGMDASVVIKPAKQIEWSSRLAILRAKNKDLDDWLILMPADRVGSELAYLPGDGKFFTKNSLSFEAAHVFEQTRVPDEKNGKFDYKAPPGAYTLLNFQAASTLLIKKFPLTLAVGVRNIFNTAYRDYLNSLRYFTDEMGRNISFRVTIPIGNIK
jgi:iron complex outermembrane recepter protein